MQISGLASNNQTGSRSKAVNAAKSLKIGRFDKIRAEEAEREIKMRENENIRIDELNAGISDIADKNISSAEKEDMIKGMIDQINEIYKARADRAQAAAEREIERSRIEQEEKQKEKEKKSAESKNQRHGESKDDALLREDISGMVKLAVSTDGLRLHAQTKALREAEATQLENDIGNDKAIHVIKAGPGRYLTIKTKLTPEDLPNSFRSRNLSKLKEGIAKLDSAINNAIGDMNDVMQNRVENKNEIKNRPDKELSENEKGNENIDTYTNEKVSGNTSEKVGAGPLKGE